MLQIRTTVGASANGSRKAVVGSGTTSMSLSWISWKPRIDEPSNPIPSLKASTLAARGGTEKCCHTPGKSVNRRSIILTFSSLIAFTRSSAVAQFGNMASLLWWRRAALRSCRPSVARDFVQVACAAPPCRTSLDPAWRSVDSVRPVTREPTALALVRPSHELHGVFDMPPGPGQLDLAFCFELDGVLGSFRNGFGAVGFQQLPRIAMDLDFLHGVIFPLFGSTMICRAKNCRC